MTSISEDAMLSTFLDKGESFIYFLECKHGKYSFIKIGLSSTPYQRKDIIQIGNPLECTLKGLIVGTIKDERRIQFHFRKQRMRGEWFRNNKELREYIKNECEILL